MKILFQFFAIIGRCGRDNISLLVLTQPHWSPLSQPYQQMSLSDKHSELVRVHTDTVGQIIAEQVCVNVSIVRGFVCGFRLPHMASRHFVFRSYFSVFAWNSGTALMMIAVEWKRDGARIYETDTRVTITVIGPHGRGL